jgi:hypothetical protein
MTDPRHDTPDDSLAGLAAAVGETGGHPDPLPAERLRPASAAERSAAGACDVPLVIGWVAAFGCFGGVLLDGLLGRGPVEWPLAAGFSFAMLIYSMIEPCGFRTPGQRTLDLRVLLEPDAPPGAEWLRWTVKWGPLILLVPVCFVAALGFRPPGVSALGVVTVALGVQVGYWMFCLGRFRRTGRPPVYDRLGSTRVVRATRVARGFNDHGFEVLPTGPRPVLPVTLEATDPAGYPPPAGNE